jgi:hypothetical protein
LRGRRRQAQHKRLRDRGRPTQRAAFARWQVEMWFGRAKQETGFGSFEVRTYQSLIRYWLCSRMAMYFLADRTERLRGEKPKITLEQVAEAVNGLASKIWNRHWHSYAELIERSGYYQWRNEDSYESRPRKAKRMNTA